MHIAAPRDRAGTFQPLLLPQRVFASDRALLKLIYLAQPRIVVKKSAKPILAWTEVATELRLLVGPRFDPQLVSIKVYPADVVPEGVAGYDARCVHAHFPRSRIFAPVRLSIF